jgi:hypothetical protein
MPEYDNNMQAAIWKNEERKTDKHPHFKGSGEIDGVEYWVSAWKREGDNPKAPALKLRFTKKKETHQQGMDQAKAAVEFDDGIPF